jgi:methyl-accepting chemotaxis protein
MKIRGKIVLTAILAIAGFIIITNIAFQKIVTSLVNQEMSEELNNYSNLGLSLIDAKYPGDWRIDGDKLYKGDTLINENYEFVDEFSDKTNTLATIFAGDTRISTTVKDETGNRKVGTPAADNVIEKVLNKKEEYKGSAVVAGADADTLYRPIQDKDGNTIGMWFVGIYKATVQQRIMDSMIYISGFLFFVLIFGSIGVFVWGNSISKVFKRIKFDLEKLEQGDLQIQFNQKLLKRKDEVGDITRSFINMQNQISHTMTQIKEESFKIKESTMILETSANNVYNDVEDISATTEQLSAGMQETAASSEEMSAAAVEIEREIDNVNEKSNHGLEVASEIKLRAEQLKDTAIDSQKTANEIYEKANKQIRTSIEKTKAIEEIRALSKTISSITAQTNLLALNASIESARAGEAGKGFAVVANEIRLLAENSKEAVSKIEEITIEVAEAVEGLVSDSNYILEFIDNKVIKDYDVLVSTGEQYNKDAILVEEMVEKIKKSAIQLSESIKYIRQAVDEVTIATSEGASGSTEIAGKSTSIALKTGEVLEQTKENKKSAAYLSDLIQFFRF